MVKWIAKYSSGCFFYQFICKIALSCVVSSSAISGSDGQGQDAGSTTEAPQHNTQMNTMT